jgi:hypothetical protein
MRPPELIFGRAIHAFLKGWQPAADFAGENVFLNRAQEIIDAEFPLISVFADSLVPIENDWQPRRLERRLSFQVEFWAEKPEGLAGAVKPADGAENWGDATEEALYGLAHALIDGLTLPRLEGFLAAGDREAVRLWKIDWKGNSVDYYTDGNMLHACVIAEFELEFQQLKRPELPPFKLAALDWRLKDSEGGLAVSDLAELEQ